MRSYFWRILLEATIENWKICFEFQSQLSKAILNLPKLHFMKTVEYKIN